MTVGSMTKRRIPTRRIALAVAAVALIAAAVGLWAMTHGTRVAPPESPIHRAERQIRQQLGAGAELRYSEIGQRRAVCGYVGRSGGGRIFCGSSAWAIRSFWRRPSRWPSSCPS